MSTRRKIDPILDAVRSLAPNLPDEIWDTEKAAAFCGISREEFYELVKAGLPVVPIGKGHRVWSRGLMLFLILQQKRQDMVE